MDKVKALLEARGIRHDWLARQIGLTPSYLCHILAGRRRPPAGFYTKVARALGVPLRDVRPKFMERVA